MAQYLIYDEASSTVQLRDSKPVACTAPFKERFVSMALITIWYPSTVDTAVVRQAARIFAERTQFTLLADVQSAMNQIVEVGGKEAVYVCLGASPKLVKWLLKLRGFTVHTLNVSGITLKGARTADLEEYIRRKLEKYENRKFVLIDFADSGVSLYKLKRDLTDILKPDEVLTVALGCSPALNKEINATYKGDLSRIVTGIPTLQDMLEKQSTKEMFGRNKVKNPYSNWAIDTAKTLDGSSAKFQQAKAVLPSAMALGPLKITEDDWIALIETESPDVADDDDDYDY